MIICERTTTASTTGQSWSRKLVWVFTTEFGWMLLSCRNWQVRDPAVSAFPDLRNSFAEYNIAINESNHVRNYKKNSWNILKYLFNIWQLSNSLADYIFGLFTDCTHPFFEPLPSCTSLSSNSPSVLRPPAWLQQECFLLHKEKLAAEHHFPWIMWCHGHMWLIYITSLHYYWYILLLIVHSANINYSLVIIHIMLNHCPGTTWLCSLALPYLPSTCFNFLFVSPFFS